MATTGLGGALAGLALGGGNAWGQVGANTLPTGGQVVAGQATINQQGGNTLNINQSSNRAVINWSSFDVGSDATVNFYQPNSGSWTVNRVTAGQSASQILGSVNANGNIVVINPNGVIFGAGSRVDVNGLIATTSNISDQNFMAGNMKFDQAGNPNAMIVNKGDITVKDAGLVAFVAPRVSNSGTITANLGRVSLASGNKFTVDLYGDKLVSIAVDGGTTAAPVGPDGKPVDALVSNSGQIIADGGRVQMTAQQASKIVDNAINMSGVVRAQSAYVDRNGDIVLDAGPNGNVNVSGTLDVSGKAAGQKGGSVTVTGKNDVVIAGTAKVDASGAAGGGSVKIGGDYQGKGSTPTAKRTLVATGAQISASAIDSGNGGTVIVWADDLAQIAGAIDARGGASGGNGGFVETSGKERLLVVDTAIVDASAPQGTAGVWLLDPRNITVTSGTGSPLTDGDDFTDLTGSDISITPTAILAALNVGTDVRLQATQDIVVGADISVSAAAPSGGDLTLQAGRDIILGNNVDINIKGDFIAIANDSQAGTGGQRLNSSAGDFIMNNNATILASGNVTITVDPSTATAGGGLNYSPGAVTLRNVTAGGTIIVTDSASSIDVNGTLSAASGLSLRAGSNLSFSNSATATSTAGTIDLLADYDASGAGTLTLGNNVVIGTGSSGTISLQGHDISLANNASIVGTGSVALRASTASRNILIGNLAVVPGNTIQIAPNAFDDIADGHSSIIIGSSSMTGNVTFGTGITLLDPTVVTVMAGGGGNVLLQSGLTGTGNASLTVNGSGSTTYLAGTITMPGAIIIDDAIALTADTTITTTGGGSNIHLGSDGTSGDPTVWTVNGDGNGPWDLRLASAAGVTIAGAAGDVAAFDQFTITATKEIRLNGARANASGLTLNGTTIDNVVLNPGIYETLAGDFTITGSGAISAAAAASILTNGNDLIATAGDGVSWSADVTTAGGDIRLSAANAAGDDKILAVTSSADFVTGGGNVVLENNSTVAATGLGLISFAGGLSTGGGDFTATALAGDVLLGGGSATMITTGGDMTLSAGGSAAIDTGAGTLNLGGGVLRMIANTSGVVDGGAPGSDGISINGTVTAGSVDGIGQTVGIGGTVNTTGAGGISLTASEDWTGVGFSGIMIGATGRLSAGGTGGITLNSTSSIFMRGVLQTAGGGVTLAAGSDASGVGEIVIGAFGASAIISSGGDVVVTGSYVSVYDDATISTSGGDFSFAGNDLAINASSYLAGRILTGGGDLTLHSTGGVIVASTALLATGNTGDAVLGTLTLDGDSNGDDSGSVTFQNGSSIVAGTIDARGEAVDVQTALATYGTAPGGIFLEGTLGSSFVRSGGSLASNGGSISLRSAGGWLIDGNVASGGGNIHIDADSDANNVGTLTVAAGRTIDSGPGGDVELRASDLVLDGFVFGTGDLLVRRSADAGTMAVGDSVSADMVIDSGEFARIQNGRTSKTFGHAEMTGDLTIGSNVTTADRTTFVTGGTMNFVGVLSGSAQPIVFIANDFDIDVAINGSADLIFKTADPARSLGIGTGTGADAVIDAAEYALIYGGAHVQVTFGEATAGGAVIMGAGFTLSGSTRVESADAISVVGSFNRGGQVLGLDADTVNLSATMAGSGALFGNGVVTVNVSDPGGDGDMDGLVGDVNQALALAQSSGTTINVGAGIYEFSNALSISKSVALLGAGAGSTLLDFTGSASNSAIDVTSGSGITISGFEVRADNSQISGIAVSDTASNITIADNLIDGFGSNIRNSGINLGGVFNFRVSGNTITNIGASPGVGILVSGSGTIAGNTIGNIADDAGYAAAPSLALAGRGIQVVNNVGGNVLIDGNVFAPGTGEFVRVAVLVNSGVNNVTFNATDSSFGNAIVGANTFTNGNVGAYYINQGSTTTNTFNVAVSQSIGASSLTTGGAIPNAFARFDTAIPLAASGATLTATAGDWYEALPTIDKSLTIRGAQAGVSAIGRTSGAASETSLTTGTITIAASDVRLDGLDIHRNGVGNGVVVDTTGGSRSNVNIVNNFLQGVNGGSTSGISKTGVNLWAGSNTIAGNAISGFPVGVDIVNPITTGSFDIAGNSIQSANVSVSVDSPQSLTVRNNTINGGGPYTVVVYANGSGGTSAVTMGGNTVTTATGWNSVRFRDFASGGGSIAVTFESGNSIDNTDGAALMFAGPDISVVNNTLNDMVFTGNPSYYVFLDEGALAGRLVNGRLATYNGVLGSAANASQIAAIEGKIRDVADDGTLGDIVIDPHVTISTGGLQAIQDVLDFGDGMDITVLGGTYGGPIVSSHAPTGALTIWADDVTLRGSGAPTLQFLFGNTSGIIVEGSNATLTGFAMTGSSAQTASIVLLAATADNATITNNTISTGNASAHGIHVQSHAALIQGNTLEGTFGGAADGIFVDSSAIAGGTISGVTIASNVIRNFGGDGIYVDPVFGPSVVGNTITAVGDNGIEIDAPVGNVDVHDNVVNATVLNGIYIHDATGAATDRISVTGNTIGNVTVPFGIGGAGILIEDTALDVHVRSNSVSNTTGIGIVIQSGAGSATIADNMLSDTTLGGIAGIGGIGFANLLIENNSIVDTAGDAIGVSGGFGATIAGNDIAGVSAGNGITVSGISDAVTIVGNDILDVSGAGIAVRNVTGALYIGVLDNTAAGNTINGTGGDGISVELTAASAGNVSIWYNRMGNADTIGGDGIEINRTGAGAYGGDLLVINNIIDRTDDNGIFVNAVASTGVLNVSGNTIAGGMVGGVGGSGVLVSGARFDRIYFDDNRVGTGSFVAGSGIAINNSTVTNAVSTIAVGGYTIGNAAQIEGSLLGTNILGNGIAVTSLTGNLLINDNAAFDVGMAGIRAQNVTGAANVIDNDVVAPGGRGIDLGGVTAGAIVAGNLVSNPADHAIAVAGSTGGLLIQSNTVNSSVFVQQVAGGITIDANALSVGGGYAIHTEGTNAGNLTITGNDVFGYSGNGIDIAGSTTGDLLVQGNTVGLITNDGIAVTGVAGGITIGGTASTLGNTVSGVSGTGILVNAAGSGGATVEGNTATNVQRTGIDVIGGPAAIISGNTVSNVAQTISGDGIHANSTNVTVDGNTIDDVFLGNAIALGGNAGNTVTNNRIATAADSTIGLDGISIADVTSAVVEDNAIGVNSGIGGIGGRGIFAGVAGGAAVIQRNTIGDADTTIGGVGIESSASAGATIVGNLLQNIGSTGISATDSNVTVADNSVDTVGGHGILLNSVVDAAVTNNWVNNTGGDGVNVAATGKVTVESNVIGVNGDAGGTVIDGMGVRIVITGSAPDNSVAVRDNTIGGDVSSTGRIGDDGINVLGTGTISSVEITGNVVEHTNFNSAGDAGIRVANAQNLLVSGNNVSDVGSNGIVVSSSSAITVASNVLDGNEDNGRGTLDGILVGGGGHASISGNTVEDFAGNGILVGPVLSMSISTNLVDGVGGNGISVQGSGAGGEILGNTVLNAGVDGIVVSGSGGVTIDGNSVATVFGHGISVLNGGSATVSSNAIDGTVGDGIRLDTLTGAVALVSGNVVDNANNTGIALNAVSGDITVVDNVIGGNGPIIGAGINVTNSTLSNLSIANNTIDNTGAMGVRVAGLTADLVDTQVVIDGNRIGGAGAIGTFTTDHGIDVDDLTGIDLIVSNNQVGQGAAVAGAGIRINNVNGTADGGNDHTVSGNLVGNAGGVGIRLIDVDGATSVVGNVVNGTGGTGIEFGNSNVAGVLVDGNTIDNTGNHGIHVHDLAGSGQDLSVTGNVVGGAANSAIGNALNEHGLQITVMSGLDVYIANNRIGQGEDALVYHDGIFFGSFGNRSVTISNNTVDRTGGDGIDGGTVIIDLVVDGNFVGTNAFIGIGGREAANDLDAITVGTALNVTIANNTIGSASATNVFDDGLVTANTPAGNAVISSNLVQRTGDEGIIAGGNQSVVSIADNTVLNVGNVGILVAAASGPTATNNITGGVYVGGNTIDGTGGTTGHGIQFLANVNGTRPFGADSTVTGNTIDNAGGDGVNIGARGLSPSGIEGDISVVGNTIGGAGTIGGFGIFATAPSIAAGALFIDGNDIGVGNAAGAIGEAGIGIRDHNGAFTINGNRIHNVAFGGVFLEAATGTGFITGNDLRNGGSGIGIFKDNSAAALTVTNNYINEFATGLFYGSNADVTNDRVFENHLANNGVGVDHNGAGTLNASGNYWGFTEDDTNFDNYFISGGTTGLSNGVNVDATPFLISGVDANDDVAFHGDFSQLYVTALGQQVGSVGRLQEAVDLVVQGPSQSTIEIGRGTFVDTVTVNRPDMTSLVIFGQGMYETYIDGLANNQPIISVTGFGGSALGDLTFQDFNLIGTTGTNGHGLMVNGVNHVLIQRVLADAVSGDGFVFDGTTTAITSGAVRDSWVLNAGRDGIRVLNANNIDIDGVTIDTAGRDGVRVQGNAGSGAGATLNNVFIDDAVENGVNIIAAAGISASAIFEAGILITNDDAGNFNAIRVQGAGASFVLPTADGTVDVVLHVDTNDANQNYILLTGGAMDNTVTYAYDVEFSGVTGALSSIVTWDLMAADLSPDQVAALFQIERHIVHEVDNANLGLIRLIPDALFPTDDAGLNGIQNAINASSNAAMAQDSIFLQAGTYRDPSNLVGGGLNIDRNINLIGAQVGISAVNAGRDPTNAGVESILDFRNASSTPAQGIRITDPAGGPGVVIDGLVVQIGSSQANGIVIQTGSGARADIVLANNFILGAPANPGGNNGIATSGANGVTNLTITGNVVASVTGDGMFLDRVTGLIVQNNQIGVAGIGGSAGSDGIFVDRSTFAAPLSGNAIVAAGVNGLYIDRSDVSAIADNTVVAAASGHGIFVDRPTGTAVVDGNTVDGAGINGILVQRANFGVSVTDNVVSGADNASIGSHGIYVLNVSGSVVVDGNDVAGGSLAVAGDTGIVIEDAASSIVSVTGNSIASGAGSSIGGDGIYVLHVAAADVIGGNSVAGGSLSQISGDGIALFDVADGANVVGNTIAGGTGSSIGFSGIDGDRIVGFTVSGNTIASGASSRLGEDGIFSFSSEQVAISGNTLASGASAAIIGNGIFVDRSSFGVQVSDNAVASGSTAAIGLDGVHVEDTASGSVAVSGNVIGGATQSIGGSGIAVLRTDAGDVDVTDNRIGQVQGYGVRVATTSGAVRGGGNSVQHAGLDGISIVATGANVSLGGNTVSNSDTNGIVVNNTTLGVEMFDNYVGYDGATATGIDQNGIRITNTGGNVFANNNRIGIDDGASAVLGDGLEIVSTTGNVMVNANTIGQAGGRGIHVTQTGGFVDIGSAGGNVVASSGDDAIRAQGTTGAVSVVGNRIGSGGAIGGNGIEVVGGASVDVAGNTIDGAQEDGVRVNQIGGTASVAGNRIATTATLGGVGGDGIDIDNVTGGLVLFNNRIGTGNTVGGDAINARTIGAGGVDASSNSIGSTTIGNVTGGGILISQVAGAVTASGNSVAGVGGRGLSAVDIGTGGTFNVTVSGNSIFEVGGDGIAVLRASGDLLVLNNRIDDSGGNGVLLGEAGNATVLGTTVSNSNGRGFFLRNLADVTLTSIASDGSDGAGLRLERTDSARPAMVVTLENATFTGAGGPGIRVIDSDGVGEGPVLQLNFVDGTGNLISNSAQGIVFDGPDTRLGGNTFNDLAFANIGGGTGDYIRLLNAALYEDDGAPNGALNPTHINATRASFDGVVAGALDPLNNPADAATLAGLETRIGHYLDDSTLGFVRLIDNVIVLPSENGLNGIQLAISVSSTTIRDTVMLTAGTYADPSDLVGGGIVVDRSIDIIGAQAGTVATGSRDGVTGESVLDFANASSNPSAGFVIQSSGVSIDGVSILLDGSSTQGGIVIDNSVARNDIALVNNFVRGTAADFAGGPGITSTGGGTLSGVAVTGNVIEFVDGNGIFLAPVADPTVQNNRIGNQGFGATNVFGIGIQLIGTFSTPISGNTVFYTDSSGIVIEGAGPGGATVSSNTVDHAGGAGIVATFLDHARIEGNSVADTGSDGISVTFTDSAAVLDNDLATLGGDGIATVEVIDSTISGNSIATAGLAGINAAGLAGNATISDNSIADTGTQGIEASNHTAVIATGNSIANVAGRGILASGNDTGTVTVADNSIDTTGDLGISVTRFVNATISGNDLANVGSDGIHLTGLSSGNAANATIANNSVSITMGGGDGIFVAGFANVSIDGNMLTGIAGSGINAFGLNLGELRILDNTVNTAAGHGIVATGFAVASVTGNDIAQVGGFGIDLGGISGGLATVSNNAVATAAFDGIYVTGYANVTASGNSISDVGANGIELAGISAGEIVARDNSVDGAANFGITASFFANADASGNTVNDTGATGIHLSGLGGGLATTSGNTVTAAGDRGIEVSSFDTVLASGNSVANAVNIGIQVIGAGAGSLTMLDNVVATVGSYGILAVSFVNATVSGNTVRNAGLTGIELDGAGGVAMISNNTVAMTGDEGIYFDDFASATASGNSIANVAGNGIEAVGLSNGDLTITDNNIDTATLGNGIVATAFINVIATGNAVSDTGLTGIMLTGTGGGNVTASGNTVDGVASGDGIRFASYVTATASGNSIANTSDNGIEAVGTGAGSLTMLDNDIASIGSNGIQAISFPNATISGNSIAAAGLNGIIASGTGAGNFTAIGNSIDGAAMGDGINVTAYANVDASTNTIANVTGDGIGLTGTGAGNATVNGNIVMTTTVGNGVRVNAFIDVTANANTVTDAGFDGIVVFGTGAGNVTASGNSVNGALDDDGIEIGDFVNAVVTGNQVADARDNGIAVGGMSSGNATISDNTVDTTTIGSGIEVARFVDVTANGNSVSDASLFGIRVVGTDAGNVTANGNSVDGVTQFSGIAISGFVNATVTGNSAADVDDYGITISGTSLGNATVSGNSIDGATDFDGIYVDAFVGVIADGNSVANVNRDGIRVLGTGAGVVTATGNSVDGVDVGDGLGISGFIGATVTGNSVANVNDDGIDLLGSGSGNAAVSGNAVDGATLGNGIWARGFVDVTASGNSVADVGLNGIRLTSVGPMGDVTASGNSVSGAGQNGIAIDDFDNATVGANVVASVQGDGIFVGGTSIGNAIISGNSVDGASLGNGIQVAGFVDVTASGNTIVEVGVDALSLQGIGAGNLTASSNRVDGTGDDGLFGGGFASIIVTGNSIANVTNDALDFQGTGAGNATIAGNRVDGGAVMGGHGIIAASFNDFVATDNDIARTGNTAILLIGTGAGNVTATGNAIVDAGVDGIRLQNFVNATASGNTVAGAVGDALYVIGGGNVTASNNVLSDIGGNGIDLDGFLDVTANANALSGVGGDGITLFNTRNVTIMGNVMDDVGQNAGAGIRLSGYTTATIVGNSIVNLTAQYGLFIENGATTTWPAANMLIAENRFAGNDIGIFTGANVSGVIGTPPGATVVGNTIGGNTIDGNRQWGVVIGANALQHAPAAGDPGTSYLDILVNGNTIAGNGVSGDQTLATGGLRNDNIGVVLDARFNNWGDVSGPFASPTHFDRPNPGGLGNAVGDWVLYDVPFVPSGQLPGYAFPPVIPSLLEGGGRSGGSSNAPGDVLADGPGFDRNGNLFEPYFTNIFVYAFGLAGVGGGGTPAIDYAVCALGDMWQASSCQAKPQPN